ncbi:MAG: hypothetical protein PHG82_03390 [Candidatus Gracilibacteria bacterium]|nr:hypothetical protein [Candidatus Gracilibacteria bacterium]
MLDIINFYYTNIINVTLRQINVLGPKIGGALLILLAGGIISRIIYIFSIFLFKKFKIIDLIDKLAIEFEEENNPEEKNKRRKKSRFSEKIKVDRVISKAISWYIFILFFRMAISYIGIIDVESFLKDLIDYLPSLFIGLVIGFFGIRFANFVYDLVYHTLNITREQTSKIIASGAKIIILFFTLMIMLDYIKIVNTLIINTILIGFIGMLSLAGGLAFGLGGKDIAKEILESFRK